jgi:hypothetical protein
MRICGNVEWVVDGHKTCAEQRIKNNASGYRQTKTEPSCFGESVAHHVSFCWSAAEARHFWRILHLEFRIAALSRLYLSGRRYQEPQDGLLPREHLNY